jgi:uncharacterized protein YkwD
MRIALRAGFGMAVAGLAAAFLPAAGGTAAAQAACKPTAVPADEAAMIQLIAAERRAAKVPKLSRDGVLAKAGRSKSMQMARGGAFSHSGGMGWAAGRSGAQNLAMAPTVQIAFRSMMDSPPHRRNILGSAWRLTGVGAARDCSGQTFYTLNFAGSS